MVFVVNQRKQNNKKENKKENKKRKKMEKKKTTKKEKRTPKKRNNLPWTLAKCYMNITKSIHQQPCRFLIFQKTT
jgi:hypothetical protein